MKKFYIKEKMSGKISVIVMLFFFIGCAGPTFFLINPIEISQEKLHFTVLSAQEQNRLIRVTISIGNKTNEAQPFTPSQAYLVTADRRVIYAGIPQRGGYKSLPPVTTQTGTITMNLACQ